jgi:peptidoglycan/xylan/chitin deacetylase (PgdA/CDA1 family)
MISRMSLAKLLDRWFPTPLLKGSALLHLGAIASLARPQFWPWALGTVLADHLLLTACGLWPRSRVLGPNWTRLPAAAAARGAIAITIDDGPDPEVTPRVLALLDESASRATFFCIGERVARYPDLAREIVRRGHRIENHSQHHRHDFSILGPRAIAREIGAAQETIERITGTVPRFFRAPAGLRSALLQPILTRLDLTLASWTRRGFDTVNPRTAAVLMRLREGLQPGDILLLHDGHAARTAAGSPVIVEVLPPLLAACTGGGLIPVTLYSTL